MKNVFSLQRFWLLLKKTFSERPAQLFGFTALLLTLSLIMYAVAKHFMGFGAAQNLTFIWGLAGGCCFLGSFVFNYFSTNAIGSSYLTLPASAFEKWLCGIIVAGIFYPVIFLTFFRAMDLFFVAMYHNDLDPAGPFYKQMYESVYLFSFHGIVAMKVYNISLFLTGCMLTGSLYFNKVSFIKTGLVICVVLVGAYGLNWFFARILFGDINNAEPFRNVVIPVGKEEGSIDLPETASKIATMALQYIIPLVLWIVSFIRLREKEF